MFQGSDDAKCDLNKRGESGAVSSPEGHVRWFKRRPTADRESAALGDRRAEIRTASARVRNGIAVCLDTDRSGGLA
jgi:hypothetical protein